MKPARPAGLEPATPGLGNRRSPSGVPDFSFHLFDKYWAWFVMINGRKYGPYEVGTIFYTPPRYTPAGWLYRAYKRNHRYIVLNGKAYNGDKVYFSPDGQVRLEVKNKGKQKTLHLGIANGKSRLFHGPVDGYDRTFSFPKNNLITDKNSSPNFAFSFSIETGDRSARYVVERGKAHGPYDSVDHLIFSENGRHFAFVFYCSSKCVVPRPQDYLRLSVYLSQYSLLTCVPRLPEAYVRYGRFVEIQRSERLLC
jgi:hypothetical protein